MLDPRALWKDFHWTQTCYKKSFAWPMKRRCWTQRRYEKTFIGLKRAMKRLLLDPWKGHGGPKSNMKSLLMDSNVLWRDFCLTHEKTMLGPKALWKDFHWTQTCYEKTFAWPMKRPCWTQRSYQKTFIGLKCALKRILLDPWKDDAGPKGVTKRLLLDSNVPWRDFCLTHEKAMVDPKVIWKVF